MCRYIDTKHHLVSSSQTTQLNTYKSPIKMSTKITSKTLTDFAHPMINVISSFQHRLQRQTSVRTLTTMSNKTLIFQKMHTTSSDVNAHTIRVVV